MTSGPDPLDLKYAPGAEQARQDVMVGVSTVMTFIGVSCVGLRVYTRSHIVGKMGAEDWIMVTAATLTIVLLLQIVAGAIEFKLGFSGLRLSPDQMASNIKLILALVVVYKMTVTLIKLSILMIYLKIGVSRTFERLCKLTMCLLVAWQIVVVIVVPAQCTPLEKLWDFTGTVEGHCINANAFYHVTSAFHILMDIWILVLPLKLIIRIPRPPREKIALFIIFGLGVISTIASIVRLQSLRIFTLSNDPFYDSLPINTWSMVEVNIGIVCASIPSLKPLLSRAQRHYSEQLSYKCSDRKYEESDWEDAGKPTILKTGKDLMISLHPSNTQVEHEECELFDRPPPPPPKDAKFGAAQQAKGYRQVIRVPDTAYRKV
ncbi:hypothetical protein HBI81_052550 [Parastagonospora nodorum]|nr:hypothetical protein HBI10_106050 [Parastagonospora nodorum]KAH4009986.1 hypothetical protein HBI13_212620 [Parastagonospora nodorum]KAH4904821.1 hypothetical protein HBH74_179250 [Parastagonospora nodorum]KAH4991507.1 hypothetical protein HBH73_019040 [Parastagonospora nodorum]KAH5033197.1 hypothetical protein HBI75_101740 [Parastagonospora nodorum]